MIKALTKFISRKETLTQLREQIAAEIAGLAELEILHNEAQERVADRTERRLAQAIIDNPTRATISEYFLVVSSKEAHLSVVRILGHSLEERRRTALVKVRPAFENLINAAVKIIEGEIETLRSETRATAERIGLEVALPSELINHLESRIARLRKLIGDEFNLNPLSTLRHAETMLEIRLLPESKS